MQQCSVGDVHLLNALYPVAAIKSTGCAKHHALRIRLPGWSFDDKGKQPYTTSATSTGIGLHLKNLRRENECTKNARSIT